MKKKIFVIITNSYMGDILLLNSLVQNIKSLYKESFVVVLTDKQHQDSARYQQGVDDVVIWDREEKHKSLAGTIKFVLEFPYKNVFATFPLYSSDRMIILSVLLRSKYILFYKKGNFFDIFQKTKYKIIKEDTTVQKANLLLLKGLTKYPLFDMPIKFNPPKSAEFPYTKDYIAICAVTSKPEKDIPIETVEYLIKEFQNKQILFLGCGEKAEAMGLELESKNCLNFINLVNKTSITELACILQKISGLISADTGTMHLACAVDCPVACIFYQNNTKGYKPDTNLYKAVIIDNNQTPQNIAQKFAELHANIY